MQWDDGGYSGSGTMKGGTAKIKSDAAALVARRQREADLKQQRLQEMEVKGQEHIWSQWSSLMTLIHLQSLHLHHWYASSSTIASITSLVNTLADHSLLRVNSSDASPTIWCQQLTVDPRKFIV
jgi:hypothetical protein